MRRLLVVLLLLGATGACDGAGASTIMPPSPPITPAEPGSWWYDGSLGPRDFVLVRTDAIVQEAAPDGVLDLTAAGYVNPDAPTNWLAEVPYSDGEFDLRVVVLDLPRATAVLDYVLTWPQGRDGEHDGVLHLAVHGDSGIGVYSVHWPIRGTPLSLDGDAGTAVGDRWTWDAAFGRIQAAVQCASASADCIPGRFRVTLIVRAPE